MPDATQHPEASSAGVKKARKLRDENATGLLLVGLFKLTKAAFFIAVGSVAFHMIHRDLGDVVMRAIDWMRIDPEGSVANFLMDRVDLIGHHQLRQAGLYSLLYAGLCVVEGVGLMRCKGWAEYLTVTLTILALPWEIFAIIHRFEAYKLGLIGANVLVVLYLLWVLKKKKQQRAIIRRRSLLD